MFLAAAETQQRHLSSLQPTRHCQMLNQQITISHQHKSGPTSSVHGSSLQLEASFFHSQYTEPNHTLADLYPVQRAGKKSKVFRFQSSWYNTFPWLHYETGVRGVLCFYCMKSDHLHDTHSISRNADTAFAINGFQNWKKAAEKFKTHQSSHAHLAAVMSHKSAKAPVTAQLSAHEKQQQVTARNSLLAIFECIRYLGRQGLALRGHDQQEGNLKQLLKVYAGTNADLNVWLTRHQDYTSPDVQNEMLSLIANNITKRVCSDIKRQEFVKFWSL